MKKQNINDENWDYLIVLDACRYDTFEKIYPDHLQGKLERRESPGSSTTDWLEKSFPGSYDYLYISGNPFVNSKGYSLSEVSTGYYSGWMATEHFVEVVDAWKLDWDNRYETVMPEDMTKRALKYAGDERNTIIHYMQPHRPYITGEVEIENMGLGRVFGKVTGEQSIFCRTKSRFLSRLYSVWKRLDVKTKYRIKRFCGKEGRTEKFIMEGGREEIIRYYEQNLEEVLGWVRKLLPYLDGKVVITSDHGEAFGEDGIWWHEYREDNPVLLEVPWFEVDMDKYEEVEEEIEVVRGEDEEKEDKIKKKLEKLGYTR